MIMADGINIKQNIDDTNERFSCNVCSVDFTLIEELLAHVTETHTNPDDGSVSCTDCQEQLPSADDYIEHHHQHHNNQQLKSSPDSLVLEHLDAEDSSDDVNHITILNDEGEPVGLAVNNDENVTSETRKRRPPAKIREILQGEPVNKKSTKPSLINNLFPLQQNIRHSITSQRNEVELDISDVDCVRLKTNNSNSSKLMERQEEIFQYIQRVDEKLDAILKHFNVPFNPSPQVVALDLKSHQRESPNQKASFLSASNTFVNRFLTSRPRGNPGANNFYTNTQEISNISADNQQQEITQYVISEDLLESTYLRSRNRGNFSKNLVYAAFPLEERLGRNCYGRRGGSISGPKEPLEAAKLDAVREAVFRKYPASPIEEEAIWKKECVIAIDTALRSEMRQRFLAINGDLG